MQAPAQATAETINLEADALANQNVPALSRPFDYHDVGATAVNQGPWAVEQHPYEGPALEGSSNANSASLNVNCSPQSMRVGHVEAKMFHAGTAHQETLVTVTNAGKCVLQGLKFRPQVEKSGHWIDWEGSGWLPLSGPNDENQWVGLDFATKGIRDLCVNGRREPARVQVRGFAKSSETAKTTTQAKSKTQKISYDSKTSPRC
jgi:hypothetical protein